MGVGAGVGVGVGVGVGGGVGVGVGVVGGLVVEPPVPPVVVPDDPEELPDVPDVEVVELGEPETAVVPVEAVRAFGLLHPVIANAAMESTPRAQNPCRFNRIGDLSAGGGRQ